MADVEARNKKQERNHCILQPMKEKLSGNVSTSHTGTKKCWQNVQYNNLIERVKNHTESNYILCSQLNHVGIPQAGSKAIYSTVCRGHGAAVRLVK